MDADEQIEPAGALSDISFSSPQVQHCPFPIYDRLRDESPVFVDPVTGHYVLTRYKDVRSATTNFKQLSNRTNIFNTRQTDTSKITARMFEERGFPPVDTLVTNDRPEHQLYRSLVDKVFTPSKIDALSPRIAEIVDGVIDAFADQDEIDFVSQFAVRLPLTVIAEQLGVSTGDMDRFKYWSDCGTEATSPVLLPDREIVAAEAFIEMQRYMAAKAALYLEHPDDDTLLSRLVHAEVDGRRLNMSELTSILQQLLVAGNETTTAALGAGMKLLIDHPALVSRLRAEPALMPTFVEEALRLMSPVQCLFRRVMSPVEIDGVAIPEGAMIEIRFGAANRDPAQYPEPACPDLDRRNASSHLAFGAGIHLCIGNQLARGELRVAFSRLIDRLDNFRASRGADSFAYTPIYISYGLTELWMRFDRR